MEISPLMILNLNMKKAIKKAVPEAAKIYEEKLAEEIGMDRLAHSKKPLKDKNNDDDDTPALNKNSSSVISPRVCCLC